MKYKPLLLFLAVVFLLSVGLIFGYTLIHAQDGTQPEISGGSSNTAFTYQGQLFDGDVPANGDYLFQFSLYDDPTAGIRIGPVLQRTITVENGLFTTVLDFTWGMFSGRGRYLNIEVKQVGGASFTTLSPRQELTEVPFALHAVYATKADSPANVVQVAKSNGDYATVSAALASITDASKDNPYVIRIAPGIYTEYIDLKPYIDLEGSGEGVTILRQFGGSTDPGAGDCSSATLRAEGIIAPEVRHLTVESDGTGSAVAVAICTEDTGKHLRLTHVSAIASGGFNNKGIYIEYSSSILNNVTVNTSGAENITVGIDIVDSLPAMNDIAATTLGGNFNYGIYNSYSSPQMVNITAFASYGNQNRGIINVQSSPTMEKITAEALNGNDNIGIANNHSQPTMQNVTARGIDELGGLTNNIGIKNVSSTPTMSNVTAYGSGGLNSYGIANESSAPKMINVTCGGSGGINFNRGIYNNDSAPTLDNVYAFASGGAGGIGVLSEGTSTLTIQDSTLQGSDAILNGAGSSAMIANTQLDGSVTVGGGLTCVGTYDHAFVALDTTCQ